MKTKLSLLAGVAFVVTTLAVQAQNTPGPSAAQTCPPGPAWQLTPEQLAERQQKVQAILADLRAKRGNGTLTANEKACLDRMEQSGGLCINGVPRGGGMGAGCGQRGQMGSCPMQNDATGAAAPASGGCGRGFGMGWGGRGRGFGGGFGPQNGTGPCAQDGTCPGVTPPAQ